MPSAAREEDEDAVMQLTFRALEEKKSIDRRCDRFQ
jgi:hypothetical protein